MSIPDSQGVGASTADGQAHSAAPSTNHGYRDFFSPSTIAGELNEKHRKELMEGSAISEEAIRARGYISVTDPQVLINCGFAPHQSRLTPGLLIPLYNIEGECHSYQFKPDVPRADPKKRGKVIKYEFPLNQPAVLDFSPLTRKHLDDPNVILGITEGAKKADSGASHGLCMVNMNGVRAMSGRNEKGGIVAFPEWKEVARNSRTIVLLFDSDVDEKPDVAKALNAIGEFLAAKGARVKAVYFKEWVNR